MLGFLFEAGINGQESRWNFFNFFLALDSLL